MPVQKTLAYHDIHLIHTTLANRGCDQLRHLAIAEMYMGVESRW